MTVVTSRDDSSTWRIASVARATACSPSAATPRACSAASAVSWALGALSRVASPTCSVASFASSTERTCRSAPWATSDIASAIAPAARPVSSDVEAISCEAADSVCVEVETEPTSVAGAVRVRPYSSTEASVASRIA